MDKKIKDIEDKDRGLNLIARVEKVITSTGSNGQNYMIINLADTTGRIEGRKWLVTDEDQKAIQPNEIIKITGADVNSYRNQLQVKINDYEILDDEKMKKEGISFQDFIISSPLDTDKEYDKLIELISKFKNDDFREITLTILKENEKKFKTYPAAMSIHHNVEGGLFWHSYSLVRDAIAVKNNYSYADVDWELVVCGAILHDIGKIVEIADVTGSDYSLQGKMLGHISIGNTFIAETAKKLNRFYNKDGSINDNVTLLEHMIIASHGKQEFGSPVEPVIIESVILSTFDQLDARIFRINDELSKVSLGEWTARIPTEGNKYFLKHYDKTTNKEN